LNKLRSHGSGLFLIEMIIAIGFFSLACAVCVQLFVKGHLMSVESNDISRSVIYAQNAAEAFKATDGDINDTAKLLGATAMGDRIILGFDENWNSFAPKKGEKPAYRMIITRFESNGLVMADIIVNRTVESTYEKRSAPPKPIYQMQIQTLNDAD